MKTTDAIAYQDRMERELQRKKEEIRAREYAQLDKTTTTRHNRIPDMRDAYSKVRLHGDEYPEEYKDYIRRTSGRIL